MALSGATDFRQFCRLTDQKPTYQISPAAPAQLEAHTTRSDRQMASDAGLAGRPLNP
jgi:hypothetical protein